jgi:hypothetical protein
MAEATAVIRRKGLLFEVVCPTCHTVLAGDLPNVRAACCNAGAITTHQANCGGITETPKQSKTVNEVLVQ